MGKQILIISSSPRRGGNSDRLCDEFARGAREAGHQVEKIVLRDFNINFCTGCGICYNGEKPCPQRDDAAGILDKMVAADVIVLATPVYFYTMAAQLKTLIDRTCARYLEMSDKEFYFIATMADGNRAAAERTFDGIRGFLDCLENPRECGTICAKGVWQKDEIDTTPFPAEAYRLGAGV